MEEKSRGAGSRPAGAPEIVHDTNVHKDLNKSAVGELKLDMNSAKPPIALFAVLLFLGIGTGFLATKVVGSGTVTTVGTDGKVETTTLEKGKVIGSGDEETFKDSAEGVLREGGINGEGAYHLERPGGESQNVYLTSSSVDLSAFIGKKVKVWGETNTAQTAGWLMDVGKLKLL